MNDRNDQHHFYHIYYYLLRHDINEKITPKLSHMARKPTNPTKNPLKADKHPMTTPTVYRTSHVESYTKWTQNPMRLIAALICAWITIAIVTNNNTPAIAFASTDPSGYLPTFKMAKHQQKTTKMDSKKIKAAKAKGQTKLTDQFIKEQEQEAKKVKAAKIQAAKEAKEKKAAQAKARAGLRAAKEVQNAKRDVESVKETSSSIRKKTSSTPTGKKARANGTTPTKGATKADEVTPESPPQCARMTSIPPEKDDELEIVGVKPGTKTIELEIVGVKPGTTTMEKEADGAQGDDDDESSDDEEGLTEAQKAMRRAWRNQNVPKKASTMTKAEEDPSRAMTPPRKGSTASKPKIGQPKDDTKYEDTVMVTETEKDTKTTEPASYSETAQLESVNKKLHPFFDAEVTAKKQVRTSGTNTDQRTRKNVLYGKLKVFVSGTHTTAKMRHEVVRVATGAKDLDKRFCFLQHNGLKPEEVPKISTEQDIPTVVSELKVYFHNWKANTKGKYLWVDVRIGFDSDQATFLEDWTSVLSEDKHVFYVSTLQLPYTKEEYMLKQSHKSMNPTEHASVLMNLMEDIATKEGKPYKIQLALKMRKIVDGKPVDYEKQWNDGEKEDWDKVPKAVYVIFPRDQMKQGTRLLSKALADPRYKEYNRMDVALMPKFSRFSSVTMRKKVLKKIATHNDVVGDTARVILEEVVDIDEYNPELQATGRELIMKLRQPNNLSQPAFLCVDTKTWGGDGTCITFPEVYDDSRELAELLPGALYHTHGEEVKMWLTREGFAEAKATAWDSNRARPISWEEQLLNEDGDERPVWSGTKTEITNLSEVLKDQPQQRPERTDWREDHNSTTSTFHYDKQSMGSESATDKEEGGVAKGSYDKAFNPPPVDDDAMTAVTMDSSLQSSNKEKKQEDNDPSQDMMQMLDLLENLPAAERKQATTRWMRLFLHGKTVDASASTVAP